MTLKKRLMTNALLTCGGMLTGITGMMVAGGEPTIIRVGGAIVTINTVLGLIAWYQYKKWGTC